MCQADLHRYIWQYTCHVLWYVQPPNHSVSCQSLNPFFDSVRIQACRQCHRPVSSTSPKVKEDLFCITALQPQRQRGCTFICMRILALGWGTNRCFPRELIYGVQYLRVGLSLSRNLKFESSKPMDRNLNHPPICPDRTASVKRRKQNPNN